MDILADRIERKKKMMKQKRGKKTEGYCKWYAINCSLDLLVEDAHACQ